MILNGPIKLNILKPGVEEPPLIIWHLFSNNGNIAALQLKILM